MFLYRLTIFLLFPVLVTIIFFRKLVKKEHATRYKEKFSKSHFNIQRKKNTRLLWFHAASVGEVRSIYPIVNELNKNYKNLEFLVTTITLSSSKLVENEFRGFKNLQHRFLPLDVGFLIKNFLKLWKPSNIFLIDSEIWPNLIYNARILKIPVTLLNARITQKTFKRWNKIPKLANQIFGSLNMCLSSNLETKNFLLKLKAKNVLHTGNIKLAYPINFKEIDKDNEKKLRSKEIWCAISTHEGEENICLNVHKIIKKKTEIVTLIAPRHIDRSKKIRRLCEKLNLRSQIVSQNEEISENVEIIIINSFGVLPSYLKHARSVFVGKSLIEKLQNDSGQSPIEAAKSGCKIYHGPFISNFKDIYDILEHHGISTKIMNTKELADNLIKDFALIGRSSNKHISLMNVLEKKTLNDTMKNLNILLNNENIQT